MKLLNKTFIYNLILVALLAFTSCNISNNSKNSIYFDDITWKYGNDTILKNGYSISHSQFNADKQLFFNDSSFSICLSDSTLIYTRYEKKCDFKNKKSFKAVGLEKKIDTVKYDFKYINKKPKLILYINPFPLILSTNNNINLPETNNFHPIKFVVSDYSIGEQIDHTQLKIRGVYNYPNYSIKDCEYIKSKDITFKIIGYNTIYSIERQGIEPYRLDNIIKVVSNKLKIEPEYSPMQKWSDDSDYEYEFYRWHKEGVHISLSRNRYIGRDAYKTLIENKNWTLTYDDSYLQAILTETYRNKNPKSPIIH